MRRKHQHEQPEDAWRAATPAQREDLRRWILQRRSEARAVGVLEWLTALADGAEPELAKDDLSANRHLVDEYGPPRDVAAPPH